MTGESLADRWDSNMIFTLKDYLPNTEARIKRLQEVINGRPVAILAAGPSIRELEERIEELKDADICYFGFNNFFVQEKYILQKINRHFSAVMCASRDGIPYEIGPITDFLARCENNIFFSTFCKDTFGLLDKSFSLRQFIVQQDKKLIFIGIGDGKVFPKNDHPLHFITSNSLLILIQLALIGKASSIMLFGADGNCGENAEENYYRQNKYMPQKWLGINVALIHDTMRLFNPIAATAIKNTCRLYGIPRVNILNCSEKSFYTPFPKISYNDALEYLVTGKKRIGKLDLRVPAKPKMPNLWLLVAQKVLNFCKKHKWRSFNVGIAKVWQGAKSISS